MAESENKFDPYHEWLGIPKWDRPVNAYRLLGIEIFEKNRTAIEAAANRQMAYLQELSSGDEHIEEAQKLLGQVSRARVVLLNPEKKAAYDKKLSEQLDSLPDTTGDISQSTRLPTHSSAAVTLAKKEKSFNRLNVIRTTLLGVAGLLAIVCVLLFRSKPLIIRAYIDKDGNGSFDAGEEVESVGVLKYFIDEKDPDGGQLDKFSWPTDSAGIVNFQNVQTGRIGFAVEPPYKVLAEDNKLYREVRVDNGPRFFAQVVDIPVLKNENALQGGKEDNQGLSTDQGQVVGNNQQKPKPSESPEPEASSFILRGRITDANAENKDEGLEMRWFIDTDGNGVFLNGKERFVEPDSQGRFEQMIQAEEIKDQTTLIVIPHDVDPSYKNQSIPLALKDIKDGVLELSVALERKPITYQGNVQVDPEKESPEGFVVYIDKNQNAQRDDEETQVKTDAEGNFIIEETWFEDYHKPTILRVEVDPERYEVPIPTGIGRQNIKLPSITFKDANFRVAKKTPPQQTQPLQPTGPSDKKKSDPTPEANPEIFLLEFGFSGELPEGGSDEKPDWSFQINNELILQFTTGKRAYDKAAKKQNWGKIKELKAAKKNNDQQIESLLKGAKSESAKKRAQRQIDDYNKANDNINEELGKLKASRDALLNPVVMAATEIEKEHAGYLLALQQEEQIKQAADKLGVTIRMPTNKQITAWQPALNFLGEQKLAQLGLQKLGRKWVPTGVAIEADGLRQIKIFAQQNFRDYVIKKKQLSTLISQNNPANQNQIDKLQNQIDTQANFSSYKNAKKTFDQMTKTYLEHLDTLQSQREALETDKQEIETVLGGEKKYLAIIKQFPEDKTIEKKREFITNLQTIVN